MTKIKIRNGSKITAISTQDFFRSVKCTTCILNDTTDCPDF